MPFFFDLISFSLLTAGANIWHLSAPLGVCVCVLTSFLVEQVPPYLCPWPFPNTKGPGQDRGPLIIAICDERDLCDDM